MQITLNTKEMDEAVILWLEDKGFSPNINNISTRIIAGRGDGFMGTRVEVTLEPKTVKPVFEAMGIGTAAIMGITTAPDFTGATSFSQRASRGHVDE